MLWRKGIIAILPCAGITLIRFTGIISDCQHSILDKHPENLPVNGQASKICLIVKLKN